MIFGKGGLKSQNKVNVDGLTRGAKCTDNVATPLRRVDHRSAQVVTTTIRLLSHTHSLRSCLDIKQACLGDSQKLSDDA